jgi:hypothetical protein
MALPHLWRNMVVKGAKQNRSADAMPLLLKQTSTARRKRHSDH